MLLQKIERVIKALDLDLRGKTVLTEAASGAYVVTPLIAAIAGAKVYAFSQTTRYGTVEQVFANTRELITAYKGPALDITLIETITPEIIGEADIITNSGHLRPLNEEKLQYAKDSVVIPLMYEAWEWREADMDIEYIRKRGFTIGATNERHPEVDVFSYLGDMALKQILDAGLCLYKNKFVLVCNNHFGPYIAKVLARVCEKLGVIDTVANQRNYDLTQVDWLSEFPKINIPQEYRDAEAIIFTAYPFDTDWIGIDTEINLKQIKEQFSNPYILRYAGDVDAEALKTEGIRYFPSDVKSGHMGVLPSAIGFDPIIRLQCGGLKVGELLLKNETEFENSNMVTNLD